jgi:leucyl aminopeptidase
VTTFSYSSDPPAEVGVGALVLPVFEGPQPGPGVSATHLHGSYAAAKMTGKKGQNLLVIRRDGEHFAADAVLLVGAGPKADFSVATMRRVLARAAPSVRRFGKVATTFPQAVGTRHAADAVAAAVEAFTLGTYRFDRYRSKPEDEGKLASVVVLGAAKWDAKAMRSAVREAAIVAEAVCWSRDLVNTPAGDLPPAKIADAARQMARKTGALQCKIWTQKDLEKGGFGGILGVGRGSVNLPTMIELRYSGAGSRTPIALTGKGISFDSGGLSIKDAKSMERMKDDMGGAAAILATMQVIARLKPKINVIAAIPCSENLPSGSAQKPGDVIHHYGGITSEVLNTDAEGRLILADSLAYLAKQKPELIIDAATLTGGCVVALGPEVTGAFGNDDALVRELTSAGDALGEPMWQLPLFRDYRPMIDSAVADVKNSGDRNGSAITAALFLAEFVDDIPWVHLDIAGPAFSERDTDLGPRGATGVPVRTLVRFLLDRAAKPAAKAARSGGGDGR